MDGQQDGGAPGQYSPDGKWWWDGSTWVAVQGSQPPPAKPRLPHQTRSFWVGLGVIAVVLVGFGTCMAAVANSPGAQRGAKAASMTSTPTAVSAPTVSPSVSPASTPTPTAAPTAVPPPSSAPTAVPPVAVAPPPTAAPACYPLSNSGTCYEPGEFCRTSDHGRTGRAGNGEAIVCEYNNGWRWEPA